MQISIILVKPRNPQNIGAAARAMGNFGFEDLYIVAPFEPVWEEVVSAVGAHEIIKNAKVFKTLPQALSDANFILATTSLKNRQIKRRIIPLPQISKCISENRNSNIAIIFGPEKTGLSAKDIALANAVLNIPTSSKTPSINLAQAVILCCYEISKNRIQTRKTTAAKEASFKEKEIVFQNIDTLLDTLNLPPTLNKKLCQNRLRNLSTETALSKENLFFINSIVSRITGKLSKQ